MQLNCFKRGASMLTADCNTTLKCMMGITMYIRHLPHLIQVLQHAPHIYMHDSWQARENIFVGEWK